MWIIEEFRDYLNTLRYSPQRCYELPNTVTRFLEFTKNRTNRPISGFSKRDIDSFIHHISTTKSKRTKRPLSTTQINGYIHAIKQFGTFLHRVKGQPFPTQHLEYLRDRDKKEITVLTLDEVKGLFEATDNTRYGMRDRAMLTLHYSCGLRRNEGINVETTDIDFRNNLVFVRNGKFGKQRYVPFTESSGGHLKEYIHIGRNRFNSRSKKKKRKTLFLSDRGVLDSQSLLNSLKVLVKRSGIQKKVGLHTLRHSIATHLLENGMDIHNISRFLGHSSLESTQIYTHISDHEALQEQV